MLQPLLPEMREYVYQPDSFVPFALLTAAADKAVSYYYECDPNGAPIRLIDAQGALVWHQHAGPWGEPGPQRANRVENPLRFQGQYYDAETGLHYNRYRYYDPGLGEYVSRDPIGLAGGINLYQYAPNPLSWIDPLGLLNEFGIAGYGSQSHVKDGLTAHELLQNAWLRNNGIINSRSSGIATSNPAMALQENSMHKTISKLQGQYGLHDPSRLKTQSALQNINRNTAITRRGIYEDLINNRGWEPQNAKEFATQKALSLRDAALKFAKENGLIVCK